MIDHASKSGFRFADVSLGGADGHFLPIPNAGVSNVRLILGSSTARLVDRECVNGSVVALLADAGWNVIGVDPSSEGKSAAKIPRPSLRLETVSAYEDLAPTIDRVPLVKNQEAVGHVNAPRDFAETQQDRVEPDGTAIIFKPYYGYRKNLALALTNKIEANFTALWGLGLKKLCSIPTLSTFVEEAGFTGLRFLRVGRIPLLAKSMIATSHKPTYCD